MKKQLWRNRELSRKLVSEAWVDACGYVHVSVSDGNSSIELAKLPVGDELEEFAELLLEEAKGNF